LIKETRIALAIVLAVVLVFMIAGATPHFFPPKGSSAPPSTLQLLNVTLSQYNYSAQTFSDFNITQGQTMRINVTLNSLSNQTEFTIPLYLTLRAFEKQYSYEQVIASPPSPYPVLPWEAQPSPNPALPWPSYDDSPDVAKPFEAAFDPNPIVIKPNESKTAILTITALSDTKPGSYAMDVAMGNWEQTGLGGAAFSLKVLISM
jgi:hypothetical protein